jgi:hypothetical protein
MSLVIVAGCSRKGGDAGEGASGAAARGNDASLAKVQAAARALADPDPSVDAVAARMEGVIKARTNSQAVMHYDGYHVTLTTPGDRVTRIVFDLTTARPTMDQLTDIYGTPETIGRGMLYHYTAGATGATIGILAEPVDKPATETSLVRRILIEGKKRR